MTTKYVNLDWQFNGELFAEHLSKMSPDDVEACRELMGVTGSSIRRWQKADYDSDFPFPRMNNFLALCNLLDLDPRDYFTL